MNEIVACRLPSLLGLVLFLLGVWRIGKECPTGSARVLITFALLSNAFLLDFLALSRGYGLALGFSVLSLSFLLDADLTAPSQHGRGRSHVIAALWLASGSAVSNLGF